VAKTGNAVCFAFGFVTMLPKTQEKIKFLGFDFGYYKMVFLCLKNGVSPKL